jgi:uncharacterized protein YyaL (SSP411 family)
MKEHFQTNLILSRSVYIGILLGLSFFIPLVAQASEWNYRAQSKIQWRDYGAAAFAEARSAGKPLYILVYADWCHWCKKYETETLETELIRGLLQNEMVPVAVNNVEQPEIGKKLGTKLVPTSVILTPDGQRLLRFYGFLPPDELNQALRRTLSRWRNGEIPEREFGDESTCCPVP